MSRNQDIIATGATQFVVGLSQVVRLVAGPNQYAQTLKWLSGGSLEIVPIQLSGSSTAAGNAWGKGYLLSTTEVFNVGGPATMYFAASGATALGQMVLGYTAGCTIL